MPPIRPWALRFVDRAILVTGLFMLLNAAAFLVVATATRNLWALFSMAVAAWNAVWLLRSRTILR